MIRDPLRAFWRPEPWRRDIEDLLWSLLSGCVHELERREWILEPSDLISRVPEITGFALCSILLWVGWKGKECGGVEGSGSWVRRRGGRKEKEGVAKWREYEQATVGVERGTKVKKKKKK
jgi:hypothetical protein